jgi:hypothetical protein
MKIQKLKDAAKSAIKPTLYVLAGVLFGTSYFFHYAAKHLYTQEEVLDVVQDVAPTAYKAGLDKGYKVCSKGSST